MRVHAQLMIQAINKAPTPGRQRIWQTSCYKAKTKVCLNLLKYHIILTEVLDTHILVPRRVTSEKSLSDILVLSCYDPYTAYYNHHFPIKFMFVV